MKRHLLPTLFLLLCATLLAACGGTSNANSSATHSATPVPTSAHQVKVILTDTTITSSMKTFYADTPYDFIVTNDGHSPHDFIIRRRPQGTMLNPPNRQGILYVISANQLPPGTTRRFTYKVSHCLDSKRCTV